MMKHFFIVGLLFNSILACEQPFLSKRVKRQLGSENATSSPPTPYAYDASYDWGELDPAYELCQTGTQQSPIALNYLQGFSQNHILNFDYANNVSGSYYNWGFGPAFELEQDAGCTVGSTAQNCTNLNGLPTVTFQDNGINETVYLVSWHIHAPADHSVQGIRSKAELHLVHVDNQGHERAVLAILIDPSTASFSNFLAQLPFASSNGSINGHTSRFPNFNDTETRLPSTDMDPYSPVREVSDFTEFWTYRGSLTSPPCTEGIRFFIARQVLLASSQQMQDILRVSTFSAREEQQVWLQEVNV